MLAVRADLGYSVLVGQGDIDGIRQSEKACRSTAADVAFASRRDLVAEAKLGGDPGVGWVLNVVGPERAAAVSIFGSQAGDFMALNQGAVTSRTRWIAEGRKVKASAEFILFFESGYGGVLEESGIGDVGGGGNPVQGQSRRGWRRWACWRLPSAKIHRR